MSDKFLGRTASYLILKKDEKILFGRRYNASYQNGNYSLPAGHVEEGETFTEALVREVAEEININIKEEDVYVVHVMHRKSRDATYVDVYFRVEEYENEIKNLEPNKCDDLSWFDMGDLPNNIADEVLQALRKIEKGEYYSELGF